MLIVFV